MEDKGKHLDFEIVRDERRFMKCANNPSFKHSHIINENLVGVEKQKPKLKLDKLIFIGMSILDLSKQHMYRFYYDVMMPKYGDNIGMVYTDTDSCVFHTKTDDLFISIFKDQAQALFALLRLLLVWMHRPGSFSNATQSTQIN